MEMNNSQRDATPRNKIGPISKVWAERDKKFGGLTGRWADGPTKLVRAPDTLRVTGVEFRTPLQVDNFLLRTFTPGVVFCDGSFTGLKYTQEGKSRLAKADLLTTFDDGIKVADLVVKGGKESTPREWYLLEQVAIAFDIVPKLRTEEEIRSNPILLTNLDRWSQHRWHHNVLDTELAVQAFEAVPCTKPITVADLLKEIQTFWNPSITAEQLLTVLIELYIRSDLTIDISERSYGPDSLVRCC